MIKVGHTYWIDFGDSAGENLVIDRIEKQFLGPQRYDYIVAAKHHPTGIRVTDDNVFETLEEALEHFEEKAHSYERRCEEVTQQLGERAALEREQKEEEYHDMKMEDMREREALN